MERWLELVGTRVLSSTTTPLDRALVFRSGDAADNVYLLTRGTVEILQSNAAGVSVVVKILRGPTLFGAIEPMAAQATYLETVRVLGAAELSTMTTRQFEQILQSDARAAAECLIDMGSAFCAAAQRETSELEDSERRLAAVMVAYAEVVGQRHGRGIVIRPKRTQQDFADAIGASERTVSRILTTWGDREWIAKELGRYILVDATALREFAGGLAAALVHTFPTHVHARWRAALD